MNDPWQPYEQQSGKGKGKGPPDHPIVPESGATGFIILSLLVVFALIIRARKSRTRF